MLNLYQAQWDGCWSPQGGRSPGCKSRLSRDGLPTAATDKRDRQLTDGVVLTTSRRWGVTPFQRTQSLNLLAQVGKDGNIPFHGVRLRQAV